MTSPRELRVGVDARSLLQQHPRGEGKTLLQLYRHICAARPGWRVFLFGEAGSAAPAELPVNVEIRRMSLPGHRFDSWERACLPWLALRARCDVLHCASSSGPRWSPVPKVVTVHDLIPLVADDGVDGAFKRTFLRRLRNGLRGARGAIAVSEHTRQDLLRVLPGIGVPVDVVHWGASQTAAAAAVANTGLAPYLIAFGGEAPRKNTAYLLDRFGAVAQRVPRLQLVLVGVSGERERRAVQQRMADAGLSDRLRLPGFVSDDELDALIRGARTLLYLSTYEGFGMPVLEAIERGVPVIASDRSSIPEILSNVPGCFSLERTAAIEGAAVGLATDDALRSAWLAAQRSVLPRFDWCSVASQTLGILQSSSRRRLGSARPSP